MKTKINSKNLIKEKLIIFIFCSFLQNCNTEIKNINSMQNFDEQNRTVQSIISPISNNPTSTNHIEPIRAHLSLEIIENQVEENLNNKRNSSSENHNSFGKKIKKKCCSLTYFSVITSLILVVAALTGLSISLKNVINENNSLSATNSYLTASNTNLTIENIKLTNLYNQALINNSALANNLRQADLILDDITSLLQATNTSLVLTPNLKS